MIDHPFMLAGLAAANSSLYYFARLNVVDPMVFFRVPDERGRLISVLLVRDIELDKARALGHIDRVHSPADFPPTHGLSSDRETATAQAAAELLRRANLSRLVVDRSLPYIYAHYLELANIERIYSGALGIAERRTKTDEELDHLRSAQQLTEQAVEMACATIARAVPRADGVLMHEGAELTSERMRLMIAGFCLERGYDTPVDSIVVTVPHATGSHHFGAGPLKADHPVIVDVFPRSRTTRYWGDCTRTVVHGTASDTVTAMHRAVLDARENALAALKPAATAEQVHQEVARTMKEHGYAMGRLTDDFAIQMTHGTGHGIGLDVHEPILLASGGEEILTGEVLTVEPGLYSVAHGGVRVEDMVHITPTGPENFNKLQTGMDWR